MPHDLVIVGAGVAGLSLARALSGPSPLLLDKGRGVGGRCATRRVSHGRAELALDHGVPFLHGRTALFEDLLRAVPEPAREWPLLVAGRGTPCQPQAFDSRGSRVVFRAGVAALPKALARGQEVRTGVEVSALVRLPDDGGFALLTRGGERFETGSVVLTCPVPQAVSLLEPLARQWPELDGVLALMRRVHLLPCLTLLCGYDRPADEGWHLCIPDVGSPVHTLVNDSSKRLPGPGDPGGPVPQTLVIQARPDFSREHLEDDPQVYGPILLGEAARLLGDWVKEPAWFQGHRWRFARVQRGDELSRPVLLRLGSRGFLGLCGEAWHPTGGLEGALLSGQALASRVQALRGATGNHAPG